VHNYQLSQKFELDVTNIALRNSTQTHRLLEIQYYCKHLGSQVCNTDRFQYCEIFRLDLCNHNKKLSLQTTGCILIWVLEILQIWRESL
jgi:hypothetical protein